jgi:hypothetical protein
MAVLRRLSTWAIGLTLLLALSLVLTSSSTAKASPITYDASGTFGDGQYSFGGSVELDPSNPSYLSNVEFTVSGLPQGVDPNFTLAASLSPTLDDPADALTLKAFDSTGFNINVKFYTADLEASGPIPLSSVADPNLLLSSQSFVNGPLISLTLMDQGSLTPAVAAPEPASIAMLASGLFAAGGFGLLRRRQATPAI